MLQNDTIDRSITFLPPPIDNYSFINHNKSIIVSDYMERQLHRPVKEVLDELKEDESFSLISESDVYSLQGGVGVDFDEDFEDRKQIKDLGLSFREETPGRCSGGMSLDTIHGI